jgi:hypothetical protein
MSPTTYQRCLWFGFGALAATMALVVGPLLPWIAS